MFRVAVASVCFAICAADELLSPDNGIQVLNDVEQSLLKITSDPRLPAAQLKQAKGVVDDVEKVVHEVQTDSKLTKDAKAKKVLAAIAELQSLERHWQQAAEVSGSKIAASKKITALKKELTEKKTLLAKEESQLKVVKLKKELMEKQTKLRHLLKMKAKIEQEEKALHKSTGKNMVADMKDLKLLREQAKNIAIARNGNFLH